jgi:hypothetical protein
VDIGPYAEYHPSLHFAFLFSSPELHNHPDQDDSAWLGLQGRVGLARPGPVTTAGATTSADPDAEFRGFQGF